jgi:hypothetical protein
MSFFNIPDIFHIQDTIRQGYQSYYEHKIGPDARNSFLLAPLEVSLGNILDIRIRIGSRIEKEIASGTDMTTVLPFLNTADLNIDSAKKAVAIATSTINDAHPRPAFFETQAAYVALNTARSSLDIVIDAIDTSIQTAIQIASSTKAQTKHGKK